MSLRQRALALMVVLAAILGWVGLVVADAVDDYNAQRRSAEEVLTPAQDRALDVLTEALNQETGARGYVLTGDREFLVPYEAGRLAAREDLRRLERLLPDDAATAAALTAVREDLATWTRLNRREIDAVSAGDTAQARRLVSGGEGKAAFDVLRGSAEDLQGRVRELLDEQQAVSRDAFEQMRDSFALAGALIVTLALATLLLFRSWVLRPVDRLRADMRAVAAGALDHPVKARGPSEVVAIGRDAEAMRRRIVEELERSRGAVEALEQHSPAVAGLMRELQSTSAHEVRGVEVDGSLLPAEGVLAGDWWDALPLPGGVTAVVVGDVSGHGAEACMVAARFKQRLATLLRSQDDLAEAFEEAVAHLELEDERFLTCVVALIDPRLRRLSWINAGHPGALLLHGGTARSAHLLEPTGPVVGLPDGQWVVEDAPLSREDLLVLLTDGVLEARDAAGRELETSGVVAVLDGLGDLRRRPARDVVGELVDGVRRWAVDLRRDDVTCVAARLDS